MSAAMSAANAKIAPDDRVEWVEIIEPKSKEHMYANLITGECVWDPPQGVDIKRTSSSQWWELFDVNTDRFYYYNAASQTTVWHRPVDCDIIPLAKLQTLKQNTDPQRRRETSTQTGVADGRSSQIKSDSGIVSNGISNDDGASPPNDKRVGHARTSPVRERKSHHHRCGEGRRSKVNPPSVSATAVSRTPAGFRPADSGRSSDSSIGSAAQSHRKLQESGAVADASVQRSVDARLGNENFNLSRERNPVGQSLPVGGGTPQFRKKSQQQPSPQTQPPQVDQTQDRWANAAGLNRSGSFMSPKKDASDDSMHEKYFKSVESTPLSRRKAKQHSAAGNSSCESSPQSPEGSSLSQTRSQHRCSPSVAHPQAPARPSLVSSISLATDHPPLSSFAPQGHSAQQQSLDRMGHRHRDRSHQYNLDRGARERFSDRHIDKERIDERLLERNLDRGYSNDKQCYNVDKGFKQTSLDFRYPPGSLESQDLIKRQHMSQSNANRQTSRESSRKQPMEVERQSGSKQSAGGKQAIPTSDSHSSKMCQPAIGSGMKSLSIEGHLTKSNVERHTAELEREKLRNRERGVSADDGAHGTSERKHKGPKKQKVPTNMDTLGSESGCENGNTSPLYSNWDLDMQHLLPLQDYILEQAKRSGGCRMSGDPLEGSGDSDSLHSSGSESSARSLSGHEPDNEDSDHSGSNDVYLQHQPPPAPISTHMHREDDYMNHDVAYYNTFMGFEKQPPQPSGIHRSASGTGMGYNNLIGSGAQQHQMPAFCEALYSPVKSHPALHHTPKETDIEKFAQDNLNLHSKGIFRKKASVRDMLSWTSSSINGPMLGARRDKASKKAAIEIFKLVQIYMGDRKARPGMTLNSVAIDILHATYSNPALRDELYVQLCRQTTENPQRDSLLRGWELLAVCLAFVPPSPAFQPPLLNYMNRHRDPTFADTFHEVGKWPIHVQVSHYAGVACRRLERIGQNGKKQPRKPNTEDIDQARIQIFKSSMFGNNLSEVMALQKERFPNRQLPWIQVTLSQQVLALQGKQTEGIFRVSADVDEVNALKARLDNWELPEQIHVTDAHAPASLLKLWYRELYEPLIPDTLYAECVSDPDNIEKALDVVQRLPRINRLVLTYLIGFLQQFSTLEVVQQTKMDSANLAMVFAPNCLRCTSQDPRVILENARKEMTFLRCLILHMDTQHVRDML